MVHCWDLTLDYPYINQALRRLGVNFSLREYWLEFGFVLVGDDARSAGRLDHGKQTAVAEEVVRLLRQRLRGGGGHVHPQPQLSLVVHLHVPLASAIFVFNYLQYSQSHNI